MMESLRDEKSARLRITLKGKSNKMRSEEARAATTSSQHTFFVLANCALSEKSLSVRGDTDFH